MRNLGIRDGHVVAISTDELDATDCPTVIDAGHLRIGDRADIVILDPQRLDDSLDSYAEEPVEQYGGLSRMVNRNDDTVTAVLVGGRAVYLNGVATELVGNRRTGRFLWAAHKAPALPSTDGELSSVG